MGSNQKQSLNAPITTGQQKEEIVRSWLEKKGWTFLAARFKVKGGEIDLIMLDREVIVFVEVRFRKNDEYGEAVETIDAFKQHRILKAANYYLLKNRLEMEEYRFDVVAITGEKWLWLKNAFCSL